jgi:hypothetical protein
MQALKQAAREADQVRLDAVCEEWSVSAGVAYAGVEPKELAKGKKEKAGSDPVSAASAGARPAGTAQTGLNNDRTDNKESEQASARAEAGR